MRDLTREELDDIASKYTYWKELSHRDNEQQVNQIAFSELQRLTHEIPAINLLNIIGGQVKYWQDHQ